MQRQQGRYNPKRRLVEDADRDECRLLAARVCYGGNPEHKRNPGDFGLDPPASPRPHKSLCDDCGIFRFKEAQQLLTEGVTKGLISHQRRGAYPQNIWAVTDDGCPVEAQLENQEAGRYHGYPMPSSDPLRYRIIECWKERAGRFSHDNEV